MKRLEFENGWMIDVHKEKGGETYYQRWPPKVENQSFLSNLQRMSSDEFNDEITKHPHKVVDKAT